MNATAITDSRFITAGQFLLRWKTSSRTQSQTEPGVECSTDSVPVRQDAVYLIAGLDDMRTRMRSAFAADPGLAAEFMAELPDEEPEDEFLERVWRREFAPGAHAECIP